MSQDPADAVARQTLADIRDGPPTLYRTPQDDGRVKIDEPFAAPGEWLAVRKQDLIPEEKCR